MKRRLEFIEAHEKTIKAYQDLIIDKEWEYLICRPTGTPITFVHRDPDEPFKPHRVCSACTQGWRNCHCPCLSQKTYTARNPFSTIRIQYHSRVIDYLKSILDGTPIKTVQEQIWKIDSDVWEEFNIKDKEIVNENNKKQDPFPPK